MNKLERIVPDLVRWLLVAVAALTPLLMSLWHYDAYDLPKITFVYVATLFLVFLVAFDMLVIKKQVVWVKTPLDLPIALFLLISTLAVASSRMPLASIVGEYARYETLQSLYAFAIIYRIAAQYFEDVKWLNTLFMVLLAAMSISVLYGLLQGAGLDIMPAFMKRAEARARSTMGNAVFYGAYLTVVIPLFFSLLFDKSQSFIKKPELKIWLIVTIILGCVAMLLTESRGPWLGLLAGLVAAMIMNFTEFNKVWPKLAMAVIAVVLITVLIFVISTGGKPTTKINELTSRFSDVLSYEGSVVTRVEIWKSAVKMIAANPLLGYGLDQTQFYMLKYRTLTQAVNERFSIPDRAHNEYLQVLVDSGVLGGLAFAWILIAAYRAWKRRSGKYDFYLKALGAGFVGYLVQAITGISMTGTTALLAVLAGVTSAYSQSEKRSMVRDLRINAIIRYGLVCITAVIVIVLSIGALVPFRADMYFYSAMAETQSTGISTAAIEKVGIANELWPYQGFYSKTAALWLMDQAIQMQSTEQLEDSIKTSESILDYYPDYSEPYLIAGRAYLTLGRVVDDQANIRKGEAYLRIRIELDPLDPLARESLLNHYVRSDRYKEALAELDYLLRLFPTSTKHLKTAALMHEALGDNSKANAAYRQIKKLDPNFPEIDLDIERTSADKKVKS